MSVPAPRAMMTVALLVFLTALGSASEAGSGIDSASYEFAPNFRADSNLWSEKIRQDVTGREGFSKIVPPTSNRSASGADYSDSGTDVNIQIRFFKVQVVSAAEGWMRLKVWMRMQWVDSRLAWDPSQYGGVTTTYYQGDHFGGAETAEIWVPDLQAYNANSGMVMTLEPAAARVSYDGTVFFSRPGSLEVMCKFSGLVAFPFDQMKCVLEMGGWTYSGGHQGVNLMGGGYSFSNQEATAGSSYQENEIVNVTARLVTYEYPSAPSEPWPVVLYEITLGRAAGFYIVVFILTGIIMTLLSFAVFWADTGSADALGYGISVIIVNILSGLSLMSLLPVCGELVWIDLFSLINTIFCIVALAQSCFNIMLENKEDETLLPAWTISLYHKIRDTIGGSVLHIVKNAKDSNLDPTEALKLLASNQTLTESVAGVMYRQQSGYEDSETIIQRTKVAIEKASTVERAERLLYFEQLFFTLDSDCSLYIDAVECDTLLSYALLKLDPVERKGIMKKYDTDQSGKLNRVEFCQLCTEMLWDVPSNQLDKAMQNAQSCKTGVARRNSRYWKDTADWLDGWSRIVIPGLYFLAMIIVFNLDLGDEYLGYPYYTPQTKPETQMVEGIPIVKFTRIGGLVAYCVLVLVCTVMYFSMTKVSSIDGKKRTQAVSEAASKVAGMASMRADDVSVHVDEPVVHVPVASVQVMKASS